MTAVPNVTLNNGVTMPQLGFGVFQVPDQETTDAVHQALEAGYRSIDTAAIYGNERGVGKAIADSGIAREDLFVTTKLWNEHQGYDQALRRLRREPGQARARLRRPVPDPLAAAARDATSRPGGRWRSCYADGRARAIGVSNFQPQPPAALLDETGVMPAVNQIELHPASSSRSCAPSRRARHRHRGVEPARPGQRCSTTPRSRGSPSSTARPRRRSCCAGTSRLGNIVIPKSVTPSRIRREHRRLRLRARRRGPGRDRHPGPRRPDRPRPRHPQLTPLSRPPSADPRHRNREGRHPMQIDLSGRTALVTGSTQGIGRPSPPASPAPAPTSSSTAADASTVEAAADALRAEVPARESSRRRRRRRDRGGRRPRRSTPCPDVDILVNNLGIFGSGRRWRSATRSGGATSRSTSCPRSASPAPTCPA